MIDFISGLLVDLSLIGGVILVVLSFFQKYKKHRLKMVIAGLVLFTVGIIFLDTAALSEAYQNGVEWGRGNLSNL